MHTNKTTNKNDLQLLENDQNNYKPNSFLYFQNKKRLATFSDNSTSFVSTERQEDKGSSSIVISSLVRVPVQNRNNYSIIKDSSISSLLTYSYQIKRLAKEKGKKKYKNVINHFLTTSNTIIQYLESPLTFKQPVSQVNIAISPLLHVVGGKEQLTWFEKKNKILDIKNNTETFIGFKSTFFSYNYFTLKTKIKYYIKKVIKDILKSNLSKKDKILFKKLLSKVKKIKKINSKLKYQLKKRNFKQKYRLKKRNFKQKYRLKKKKKIINLKIKKLKKYVTLKTRLNSKLKIKKIKFKQKYQLKKIFNSFKGKGINKKRLRFNTNSLVYSLRINKKIPSIKQNLFYSSFTSKKGKRARAGGQYSVKRLWGGAEMNSSRLLSNSPNLSSFRASLPLKYVGLKDQYNNSNENAKIIWLLNNKSLIEDYFKIRNLGSLDQYKEKHSLNYKRLSLEDKKIINALNFIDYYKNFREGQSISNSLKKNKSKKMNKATFISPLRTHVGESATAFTLFLKKSTRKFPSLSEGWGGATSLSALARMERGEGGSGGSLFLHSDPTKISEGMEGKKGKDKQGLVLPKTSFIKAISPFNPQLAQSNNIMYFFNKKNNYNIFKNEQNIREILEAAFLSMNTFISKAYFSVKPNSILINLFFFWMVDVDSLLAFSLDNSIKKIKLKKIMKNKKIKEFKMKNIMKNKKIKRINNIKMNIKRNKNWKITRKGIRMYLLMKKGMVQLEKRKRAKKLVISLEEKVNKNMRFSKKFSRFAVLFEKKIKRLTWVLTKLLKKRVNFQFTRVFYPYNDCNILLFLLGFLGFWFKFNRLVLELILNINFKIKKKRLLRLKYRNIPSVVTGLNIKLAGRISKVRSKKRVKTLKWDIGSLARSVDKLKVNNQFTNKTVAGAFNISMQHNATVLN